MKRQPILIMITSVGLLALTAGVAALAGCGTTPASQPGAPAASTPAASTPAPGSSTPAPASSTPATSPSTPAASPATPPAARACLAPGIHLTGIRVGQHAGFDRVVFQFSGGLPVYRTEAVQTVYSDPKGDLVPLAGQQSLRVVFRASAWCQQPVRQTYIGPSVLTPYYPRLLVVSTAGDFEQVLSFGIGTAASGSYHAYSLTGPDRVVIDFTHVALGKFPGIWDITSWQDYWTTQYAWNNGHQPWLGSPAMVVKVWAPRHSVIRQVGENTFRVTEPGGRVDTVTGIVPVTVPGPWVITRIAYGTPA